jgi:hypothetical protein
LKITPTCPSAVHIGCEPPSMSTIDNRRCPRNTLPSFPEAVGVRAAMGDRVVHPLEDGEVALARETGISAHGSFSYAALRANT